jgi:transcriptional regulator with PAS, ATPase and Fis domain
MPGADAGQRTLVEQEVSLIQDALQQAGGNRGKAARQLGIDRVSLWRKIKKYGLDS